MRSVQAGLAAAAALVIVSGCTSPEKEARYMAGHFKAQADLFAPDGARIGTAIAEEVDGALRVGVDASGLTKGPHGTHIHMVGMCEAPGFTSAGGHWNPGGHQHGKDNPAGPHAGDLPNLVAGEDGRGKLTFTIHGGSYAGLLDEDGAALVIHADADDYKTDPTGNSGGRIACGVFKAM